MPLVSRTFDQLIDFTRTSAATYVDATGKIVSTLASRNLLTFTQEFDNAVWNKGGVVTVTANSTTAPDGTLTADTVTAISGASIHRVVSSAATIAVGTSCVHSVYVKAGTHNLVQIHDGASAIYFANFNLSTGAVGTSANCTASITAVGDGWYRCAIIFTVAVANPVFCLALISSASAVRNESWTAAGTETIYLWGAQLEANTTATDYTRNNGGVYPPRFDYDPVTLAPKGLLVEEQRTNLLTYSEEFDNAAWVKPELTVTANATTSPDGTADADLLVPSVNASAHQTYQSIALTNATAYTCTVYAKAGGYNFVNIRFGGAISSEAFFDLSNGSVVSATTLANASITAVGNGWYRCSYTATATSTASFAISINPCPTSSSYGVAGNGTSGVYVWGAQLEAGAFATSYIPTVASQVTRTADVAAITGANFSQWYNQSEGTFVVGFDTGTPTNIVPVKVVISANVSSAGSNVDENRIITYNGQIRGSTAVSGVTYADISAGTYTAGAFMNASYGYATNNFGASLNGAAVVTDTSGSVPLNLIALLIGSYNGSNNVNGHIRSIRYYPTRLSNAQLQALTA